MRRVQPCAIGWCVALAGAADRCVVHAQAVYRDLRPQLLAPDEEWIGTGVACDTCQGRGVCEPCWGDGEVEHECSCGYAGCRHTCADCHGSGICAVCGGAGFGGVRKKEAA